MNICQEDSGVLRERVIGPDAIHIVRGVLENARKPDIGLGRDERKSETRWQDADHGGVVSVDGDRSPYDGRVRMEMVPPERIADQGDVSATGRILLGRKMRPRAGAAPSMRSSSREA